MTLPRGTATVVLPLWDRLRPILAACGPIFAVVVVYLLFAVLEKALIDKPAVFMSAENLRTIIVNSAVIGVCALGMTIVIIAGGIDLSVGSGVALCATVLACGLKLGWSPGVALAVTIATGCALGAINGILVSTLRVVPFIVTLGTMTAYLGAGKMIADQVDKGGTVRPISVEPGRADFEKNQVPVRVQSWLSTRAGALWPPRFTTGPDRSTLDEWLDWLRFPPGIWAALLLAGFVAALLHGTVFGRYVFALGSNEATARLCGVNVPLVRISVYTLCGLFVALAGIYQFSRLKTGSPTSGAGLELKVIAAVVIGGGSLAGGRGAVLGTLAGATLMAVIASGCTQLGIGNALQDVILGILIVAAVSLDQWRSRKLA